MNHSPLRAFVLILFVLAFFALSPQARAACQEGCLTNDNTVLGDDALFSNTNGSDNTANGAFALQNNTAGEENTATGANALLSNTSVANNTATGHVALFFNTSGIRNTANGGFGGRTATGSGPTWWLPMGLPSTVGRRLP